jgi:regulatory protein
MLMSPRLLLLRWTSRLSSEFVAGPGGPGGEGDGWASGRGGRARFQSSRGRSGPRAGESGGSSEGRDGEARSKDSRGGGAKASSPPADPVQQAKEICLRLLTVRPRTRLELAQALARKGIEDDVVEQVLSRFDEVGLVDDAAFADVWVRSRHNLQGLSRRALAMELRRKGVADESAAEALATVDTEAEEERARQLVRKRLRALGSADEAAKIRKLVGMLARKGYSQGLAYRVVKEELRTSLLDETF